MWPLGIMCGLSQDAFVSLLCTEVGVLIEEVLLSIICRKSTCEIRLF